MGKLQQSDTWRYTSWLFAKTLESHTKGDNCNTEIVIATVHTGFVGSTTCADAFGGMLWLLSGQR